VGLVALGHVYILVLEMFLWDKPAGLRAFGQTKEAAAASKVLAANQGLGVYGAVTANRRILFVQAIPAAIGLALVLLSATASS
jgi:putative membrane protein